jgi:hypothetical protein
MIVLITGAASAAAFRLRRLLEFDEVIFADHLDLPQSIFKETRFMQIPAGDSPSFAHQLLKMCLDNHIEMVFPLRLQELRPLAEAKVLFEEYGITLVVPEVAVLDQIPVGGPARSDFIILSDGMIIGGQFMELLHLPCDTGIFTFDTEDPSAASLFTIS